ncbi:MAG: hypothetical protein J6X60_08985 [Ruminiclostridium sp.]|nr:hypothetical protein [Ruminiclostridium sp.]
MIETIFNAVQLIFTLISAGFAAYRAIRTQKHAWLLCSLASGVYFLGDLYWQLYLVFYDCTPHYSYIPELGWRACCIFLLILLTEVRGEREKPTRVKKVLFIIPVFTVGMSSYYALYDGITTNLIIAVVMTLLLWNTIDCLIDIHRGKVENPDCKWLCVAILIYCASEYAAWTVSCEWQGDTLTNPYFLFEAMLALSFVLFLPAVEKAVKK